MEPTPDPTTQPEPSAAAYTGWIRADTDHLIRGWATNRAERSERLVLDILIDDEPVARLAADRLDPKLVELGEADGRYAFALVIPDRFRDGGAHSYAARILSNGQPLKCKAPTFLVPADTPAPRIEVDRIGHGAAEGSVPGGSYSKLTQLELWRGGRRFADGLPTSWSRANGFHVILGPDLAAGARPGDLVLAAPGMIEAGLPGAPLTFDRIVRQGPVAGGNPPGGDPVQAAWRDLDKRRIALFAAVQLHAAGDAAGAVDDVLDSAAAFYDWLAAPAGRAPAALQAFVDETPDDGANFAADAE